MKNRKRGFSLVELLIVLAVIAALIATITPVALNAIRKSKATQVAQNLKTLASAFENKLYVDGVKNIPSDLASYGRDIDKSKYGLAYYGSGGDYTAVVWSIDSVSDQVETLLPNAKYTETNLTVNDLKTLAGVTTLTSIHSPNGEASGITTYYIFNMTVY